MDLGNLMAAPGITATGDKIPPTLMYPLNVVNCRYDEDEAKSNRDSQEKSRAALQRYLFYCNRSVRSRFQSILAFSVLDT